MFVLLDAIEAIDWSRALAVQDHRFSRRLNYSPWLTCDASTMTSRYRFHTTLILPHVAQRDEFPVSACRGLTVDRLESTSESDAPEAPKCTSGQQTGVNRPRDEEVVVMTDMQDEFESDGHSS